MSDPRRELLPLHEAQHSFDVVLRGYDRSQVADTIERLEADFRIAIADRDAAAARSADLAGQLSALHGEIEQLRRKAATASAPTFENISERIQHMLQLAEEEAAEIRRAAESDAMAVREQTAAAEQHAAALVAEAEAKAEAIRDVRDELTGRLVQARQLLDRLPDLGDRPQQSPAAPAASQPAPSTPAPATAREPEQRPQPAPQAPAQTTAPAAAQPQPVSPSMTVAGRGMSEAGAARQPTRTEMPVQARTGAAQDDAVEAPTTRQLPMPPRPGTNPGHTAPPPVQGPPTQVIDQASGQGRS